MNKITIGILKSLSILLVICFVSCTENKNYPLIIVDETHHKFRFSMPYEIDPSPGLVIDWEGYNFVNTPSNSIRKARIMEVNGDSISGVWSTKVSRNNSATLSKRSLKPEMDSQSFTGFESGHSYMVELGYDDGKNKIYNVPSFSSRWQALIRVK